MDLTGNVVKWKRPNVIVMLLGDVVDAKSRHGEFGDMVFRDSLSDMWILEFLKVAATQAETMGSTLVAILGNHELMNFKGEMSYASPHHVKHPQARREYFAEGGGRNALETLFHTSFTYNGNHYSHAGIPLDESVVQKKLQGKRVSSALLALANNPHLEDLVSHRDYLTRNVSNEVAAKVGDVCREHRVRRMVIGHNYTDGAGVVSSYGGRVVYADTGISKAFTPNADPKIYEIVHDPGDGVLCLLTPGGTKRAIPIVG